MNINRILRRVIYACLAGIILLPFAPVLTTSTASFSMFFPYITIGAFLFRIFVLVAFGAWLILILRDKAYRPRLTAISVSFLAFILIVLIADLFGVDRLRSIWSNFERMEGFLTWSHLVMLFFVTSHVIRQKKQWVTIATYSWFVAVFACLVAMISFDGVDDNRISGLFGNPIYFAIYTLIHIYIALFAVYKYHQQKKLTTFRSLTVIASIILFVYGIILSGTRGTFVALGLSLFVSAIILALKEKENRRIRQVSFGLIGIVIAMSLFLFFARGVPALTQYSFIERASSVFDMRHNTVFARFNNWQIAFEAFKERPILGWGQDNYIYPFASHHNPKMFAQEPWFDRTHNVILDWLISAGILGLLAYLCVLVSVFVTVLRSKELPVPEQAIIVGILSGYFVHNIFVFDYLLSAIALVLLSAYVHSRNHKIQSLTPEDKKIESSEYLAVGVISVATLVGVYYLNIPGMNNAITLSDAVATQNVTLKHNLFNELINSPSYIGRSEIVEQFVINSSAVVRAQGISDDVKVKFQEDALKAILREVSEHPNNVRSLTFLGTHFLTMGNFEEGIKVFEKARSIAPNRQANLITLSSAYSLAGKNEEAVLPARHAFLLDQNNDKARINLMKLLVLQGNVDEAKSLQRPQDELNPEVKQTLISAYLKTEKYAEMITLLKPVVEADPSNIQDAISLSVAYLENGQRTESVNVLLELKKYVKDEAIISDLDSFIATIRAGGNPIVR